MKNLYLAILLIFISLNSSFSQNILWGKTFDNDTMAFLKTFVNIEQKDDGNLYLFGTSFGEPYELYELNLNGDSITTQLDSNVGILINIPNSPDYYRLRYEGNFFITGTFVERIDQNFNVIWSYEADDLFAENMNRISRTSDDGVICIGNYSTGFNSRNYAKKLDANGNVLWVDSTSLGYSQSGLVLDRVIEISGNQYVFSDTDSINVRYYKFDSNGLILDSLIITGSGAINGSQMGYDPINDEIISHNLFEKDSVTFDLRISSFDSDLNLNWSSSSKELTLCQFDMIGGGQRAEAILDSATFSYALAIFQDSLVIGSVPLIADNNPTLFIGDIGYLGDGTAIVAGSSNFTAYAAFRVGGLASNIHVHDVHQGREIVYPIPAGQILNFDLEQVKDSENSEIKIYDLNGRIIDRAEMKSNFYEFDVSSWQNGLYLYEITSGDKKFRGKVKVEN